MRVRPADSESPAALIVPDSLTALGLVRSLGPRGVPCTVGTSNALGPARYSRYAHVVACPQPTKGRGFVDALLDIGRSFPVPPLLFVTDESSLLLVQRAREELAAHFLLTIPSPAQFEQLLSKPRLYEVGAAAGVPVPQTWVLSDRSIPSGLEYPLVMKPANRVVRITDYQLRSFWREFGCKALLVANAREATAVSTRARALGFEMLLQEAVPGPVNELLTAGVFAGSNGSRAVFTARKLAQVPTDFGDGSVVEGVPLPELEPLVSRLLDYTGFVGLADIEFKRDARDGRIKLLDVNPRPWLWIELASRCGVNLPYLLYREAVGRGAPLQVQTAERIVWCSVRALFRRSRRQGPSDYRTVLHGLVRVARGAGIEAILARHDLLWRMFIAPRFWRAALRSGRSELP
jgi:D-aspartate ligase